MLPYTSAHATPDSMKTKSDRRAGIKVICFDFDGTVAATMPFLTALAVEVLTGHCRMAPEDARRQYISTTGLPFEEQAERICGRNDGAVRAAVSEFEARKRSGYFNLAPEEGARETLEALKRRGYRLSVSSSTHFELVREYVARFDLAFDLVLGLKPNFRKGRDHFRHIQRHCGIDSRAICFVADSINDYHVAVSNGVDFIAKCGLFDPAAFQAVDPGITAIAELKELLDIF